MFGILKASEPKGSSKKYAEVKTSPHWQVILSKKYMLRNVVAGMITSTVTITYAFSYAAVIFPGDLSFAFSYGVGMALITAMTAAIVTAMFGSLPFGIAGPDVYSALPLAATVAVLAKQLPLDMPPDIRLVTVLGTLTVATVITGAGLVGLGFSRAAVAFRYIPYPVVAGFIAATGLLIVLASLRMVTGVPLSPETWPQFVTPDTGSRVLLTTAFAIAIAIVSARVAHSLTLPIFVVLGVAAVHIVLLVAGVTVEDAREEEWLFTFVQQADQWNPWSMELWSAFDGPLFLSVLPNALAVLAVTALAIVMSATSLELITGADADLNRELCAEGAASLCSAALGGFVGSLSVSRSSVARSSGATGVLAGVVCGLCAGAVLLFGPQTVAYMPKPVLAGVLMFLGAQFLWKWVISSRRDMRVVDYLTILCILVVVYRYGYVAGVAAGILLGCIIFAVRYAGTPSIKHALDLAERRSNVERSIETSAKLSRLGAKVPILQLQGFLFFGSAHQLLEHARSQLGKARFLVLDFKLVSGMDSSAAFSFQKMAKLAQRSSCSLIFAGLSENCLHELAMAKVVDSQGFSKSFPNLDSALEFAEDQLIAEDDEAPQDNRAFRVWLQQQLGSQDAATALYEASKKTCFERGDYICRQGEDTDCLLFIDEGQVEVLLERSCHPALRLRSFQGQTVLGEMGFFLETPRSASILAEAQTVVYRLDRQAYKELAAAYPRAILALDALIIRLLSERLKIANSLVAAYER